MSGQETLQIACEIHTARHTG